MIGPSKEELQKAYEQDKQKKPSLAELQASYKKKVGSESGGQAGTGDRQSGLIEKGNIDLYGQPSVKNPETGGMSTVFSTSIGTDKGEVLISRVTPDGKFLSEKEAIDYYKKTGKHLGVFKDVASANKYAEQLHKDYESGVYSKRPTSDTEPQSTSLPPKQDTPGTPASKDVSPSGVDLSKIKGLRNISDFGFGSSQKEQPIISKTIDPLRDKTIPIESRIFSLQNDMREGKISAENYFNQIVPAHAEVEKIKNSFTPESAKSFLSSKLKIDPDRTDLNSIADSIDKSNLSEVTAFDKYQKDRNLKESIAEVSKDVLTSSTLEEAAMKYAQKTGKIRDDIPWMTFGNATKGQMLMNMFNSQEFQSILGHPEIYKKFKEELFNLPNSHPEYVSSIIKQVLSNEFEKKGYNNWAFNISGQEHADEIIDEQIKSGKLPATFKSVYEKFVRPKLGTWQQILHGDPLETPGFVEQASKGAQNMFYGTGKSVAELTGLRGLYKSDGDIVREETEKKYDAVNLDPQSFLHKMSMNGGNITGTVLAMSMGGRAAIASDLLKTKGAADALAFGLGVWGEYNDKSKEMTSNPLLQALYSTTMTTLNMVGARLLPGHNITELLSKEEPSILHYLSDAAEGKVTAAAAKNNIMHGFINWAKQTAIGSLKGGEFMGSIAAADNMLSQAIEGKHVDVSKAANEAWQSAQLGFLGSIFLSGFEARGSLRGNKGIGNAIYAMVSNPDYTRSMIEKTSVEDKEFEKISMSAGENLNYLSKIKKQLDETTLTDDQKKRYVLLSASEKMLQNKLEATTEPELKKPIQEKLNSLKDEKSSIIKPEAPPVHSEVIKNIEESNKRWKENIEKIDKRDDIDEKQKRSLKETEDKRHADEISGIMKPANVVSAVIEIGGKTYEGKNHAEALLKAKEAGEDISKIDRQAEGKFKLSDGTIIDRAEAMNRFGRDHSEQLIPQDDAAKKADEDLKNIGEPATVEKTPEQTIKEIADSGKIPGMIGDMMKAGQITPEQGLLELAKQKHGVSDDGSELEGGGRDIAALQGGEEVDKAVTKKFPDKQSVIDEIEKQKPKTDIEKLDALTEKISKSNKAFSDIKGFENSFNGFIKWFKDTKDYKGSAIGHLSKLQENSPDEVTKLLQEFVADPNFKKYNDEAEQTTGTGAEPVKAEEKSGAAKEPDKTGEAAKEKVAPGQRVEVNIHGAKFKAVVTEDDGSGQVTVKRIDNDFELTVDKESIKPLSEEPLSKDAQELADVNAKIQTLKNQRNNDNKYRIDPQLKALEERKAELESKTPTFAEELAKQMPDDLAKALFPQEEKSLPEKKRERKRNTLKVVDRLNNFADRVEKFDITGSGGDAAQMNLFKVPQAVLATSVRLVAKAIEAGKALADAIKDGLDYLESKGFKDTDSDGEYTNVVKALQAGKRPKFNPPVESEIFSARKPTQGLRDIDLKPENKNDLNEVEVKEDPVKAFDNFKDVFSSNLNILGRESAQAKMWATKLAASKAQVNTIMRNAVPKIQKLLGKGGAQNLSKAIVQSRLNGIRERWNNLSTAALHLVDAEVESAYEGGIKNLIKSYSNHYPELMAEENTQAAIARGDMDGFRQLTAAYFKDAADNVQNVDFGESSYDEVTSHPNFDKALQVYKDNVEKYISEIHAEREGTFSDALGDLKTYYPLIALTKDGHVLMKKAKEFGTSIETSNFFASGLSPRGYDTNVEALTRRLYTFVRTANKNGLIETMRDAGLMKVVSGVPEGDQFININGELFKAQVFPVRDSRQLEDGKVIPGQYAIVPERFYKELKPIISKQEFDTRSASRLLDEVTNFALASPFEATFHMSNIMASLVTGTPFADTNLFAKAISVVPIIGGLNKFLYSLGTIFSEKLPDEDLVKMAKEGLVSNRYGTTTFNKEYAEATGAKYVPWYDPRLKQFGVMLFGKKGLDIKVRHRMWRLHNDMFPDDSGQKIDAKNTEIALQKDKINKLKDAGADKKTVKEEEVKIEQLNKETDVLKNIQAKRNDDRRQFVNQLGNYVWATQGSLERMLKRTGLTPFYTAGSQMLRNGVNAWLGTTPLSSELSWGQRLAYRAAMNMSSGLIGTVGLWAAFYYMATGKTPDKDKNARLFEIPVPEDLKDNKIVQMLFKHGNEWSNIGMGFANPAMIRGARSLGIRNAFNTYQQGGSTGQIIEHAQTDILNSVISPVSTSPEVGFLSTALMGNAPYIHSMRDVYGNYSPQFYQTVKKLPGGYQQLANIEQAIVNLNPLAKNIMKDAGVSYEPKYKNEEEDTWEQKILSTVMQIAAPRLLSPPRNTEAEEKRIRKEERATNKKR